MLTPARTSRLGPGLLRTALATLVALLAACLLLRTHEPSAADAASAEPPVQNTVAAWQPTSAPAFLAAAAVQLAAPLTTETRSQARAPLRLGDTGPEDAARPAILTRVRVRLATHAHAACARLLAHAHAGPLQTRSTSPPPAIS